MRRKTLERLEIVASVVFVVACIALMLGTLAQHGCLPEIEIGHKPIVLVEVKPATKKIAVEKNQSNLTLHWAALKAERSR